MNYTINKEAKADFYEWSYLLGRYDEGKITTKRLMNFEQLLVLKYGVDVFEYFALFSENDIK
jgi:hypothetical protein